MDVLELSAAKKLLDINNDGTVSQSEIDARGGIEGALAFIQTHHKEAVDEVEYDGGNFARYNLMRTLGNASAQVIRERFEELDRNNDGEVSRHEYRTALGRLDTNRDGTVSREEVSAYKDDPNAAFDVMVGYRQSQGR